MEIIITTILVDFQIGRFLSGHVSETSGVLIFGIVLVLSTILLRWLIKYFEESRRMKIKESQTVKR